MATHALSGAVLDIAQDPAPGTVHGCLQPSARIPELDGLRGIAVLLVVAWHYLDVWATPWLTPFRLGWSGVDLFFVLSGFLIGGILLDNRHRRSYFKPFYGRRIHRIFPLYYAWLAVVFVLRMPAYAPRWSYAVFVQNLFQGAHNTWDSVWIGHTWSLAVEEQFYLVAPMVIRFVPLRMLPWLGAAILAGAPVCRWLMPARWPLAADMMTPCRADALVCGVLVAGWIRHPKTIRWLERHRSLLRSAAVVTVLPASYLALHFRTIQGLHPAWYSLLAVSYACILLASVTAPPKLVSRLLGTRFLQDAGARSFAIYLFHLPLFAAAQNVIGGRLLPALIAGAATWVVAGFSGEYFEGPLLRRGRRKYRYM